MTSNFVIAACVLTRLILAGPQEVNAQAWKVGRLGDSTLELTAHWEPLTATVYEFEKKFPLIHVLAVAEKQTRIIDTN